MRHLQLQVLPLQLPVQLLDPQMRHLQLQALHRRLLQVQVPQQPALRERQRRQIVANRKAQQYRHSKHLPQHPPLHQQYNQHHR